MQTVLVTGANGFVGSHVLEALAAAPVTSVAACRDPARLSETFHGEVRQGDLRDPVYRQSLLQGVDVVCHTAAWTSLWSNAQTSRELYLEPSLALLADCVAAGVKRFVFLSTTSVVAPARQADPWPRAFPGRSGPISAMWWRLKMPCASRPATRS